MAALLLLATVAAALIVVAPWSDETDSADPSGRSAGRAGSGTRPESAPPPAANSTRSDVPQATSASPTQQSQAETNFALYSPPGSGYSTRIPTGPEWSDPSETEPTPDRLFRTTITGPDGLIALIDYTPFEPAVFGGSYLTRTTVDQAAYGSATEYVFQGGTLPQCRRARCVDYIINDSSRGSGYGVLVGGTPDLGLGKRIARTMMENLTGNS